MFRPTIRVLLAAGLVTIEPLLRGHLHGVAQALATIAIGVSLAWLVSERLDSTATVGGAVGALAYGATVSTVPFLAGGLLYAGVFLERTLRVRDVGAARIHWGSAVGVGAVSGAVVAMFASRDLGLMAVVVAVLAVSMAAIQLIDADDRVAHRLEQCAALVTTPAADTLREAAELRRSLRSEAPLPRAIQREAQSTWSALVELAEARVRLERGASAGLQRQVHRDAVRRRIDHRIAAHVRALLRIYVAYEEAEAAERSIEDVALRTAETRGESLEEMSRALVATDMAEGEASSAVG